MLNIIKISPRDLQCRRGRQPQASLSRSVSAVRYLSASPAQASHEAEAALGRRPKSRAWSTGSTFNDAVFDRHRGMSNRQPMGQPGAGRVHHARLPQSCDRGAQRPAQPLGGGTAGRFDCLCAAAKFRVALTHARKVRHVDIELGWLMLRLPETDQVLWAVVAHDPD